MGVSVVIPVYNSEGSLGPLAERLEPVLESLGGPYELILVNDGSADASWQAIQQLARRYAWVRGVNLMRNYGQHNALLCGIRLARHPITATMDDDLQNPPEELPKLLSKLADGWDVVYGAPAQEQHGLWRDIASKVTKIALQAAMGVEAARSVSAYRVFRTDVREAFANYHGAYVCIDVLLTWAARRFAAVQVEHAPRTIGASNYTFRKLLTHAMNMLTGFSVLPLQAASLVGFVFTLFGMAVLFFVLGRFMIAGQVVPGFVFLASIVAIFSGAQLFALGVIGEYLARIHFRSMDKPPYAVREACGGKDET